MLYPIFHHKKKRVLLLDVLIITFSVLFHHYIKRPCFNLVISMIAIFLAFSGSFLMALYTNKEINMFWKSKDSLNIFIETHRNYVGFLSSLLFLMFLLNMLQLSPLKFGLNGVISLVAVWLVLSRSWMMFQNYLDTYRNTYSNRVQANHENYS